ncbi:MAG: thioredoxin family protein [Bacteroidota bacterium]
MKKTVTGPALLLMAGVLLAGCGGVRPSRTEPSDRGWVGREIFDQSPYAPFRVAYDTADVMHEYVDLIRMVRDSVEVIIFFGGWCSDSRREVPRFLKVADLAGFGAEQIRFYALDRTKKSSDGLTDRYAIELVPTFVFLRRGEEIGRITESPRTMMEADVLGILARR